MARWPLTIPLLQHEFIRPTSADLAASTSSTASSIRLSLINDTIPEEVAKAGTDPSPRPGSSSGGAATTPSGVRTTVGKSAEFNPMSDPSEEPAESGEVLAGAAKGDVLSQEPLSHEVKRSTPFVPEVRRSAAQTMADEDTIKMWLRSQADQTGRLTDSMLNTYQDLRANNIPITTNLNGSRQYLASQTIAVPSSAASRAMAAANHPPAAANASSSFAAASPLRSSGLQLEEVPIKTYATETAQREVAARLGQAEQRAVDKLAAQKAFEQEQEAFRKSSSSGGGGPAAAGNAWSQQPGAVDDTNP